MTEKVFDYFNKICAIPHGSGNMGAISEFCLEFARDNSLKAIKDAANNVIIYKSGTKGLENAEPVILQGHLDMVCQMEQGVNIDFEKDAITPYVDGDFIKAKGTTLGADNGIAVAMIMAILESEDVAHPPIEAIFTTDEEVGMLGAAALDFENIKGKRMINLDSEEMGVLTVSCAGGSDFKINIPFERMAAFGKRISINISGLLGGHSGVDINKCRHNANVLMGRILNHLKSVSKFEICEICGGDKGNVIPSSCVATLVIENEESFTSEAEKIFETVKKEISGCESGFQVSISSLGEGNFEVLCSEAKEKLIFLLTCAPNGVIEMSSNIENLPETSLNLGILKTQEESIMAHFTLRSNKASSLSALQEKMCNFASGLGSRGENSGYYPPWEYKENSSLQEVCVKVFEQKFGYNPKIEAIHAGLECGVFASKIKDFDCISLGPDMYDIHTTAERLSISSTEKTFEYLLDILKNLK